MRVPSALVFALCVIAMPAAAFAQVPRPERPYKGLFGSSQTGDTEQSLSAQVSTGGGFDDNVYVDQEARIGLPNNPRNGTASQYASGSGSLSYSLSRKSLSLFASGSSSAQYYFQMDDGLVTTYGGHVGLSWAMSSRSRLTLSQGLTYQPLSAFAFFPDVIELEPGDTPSPTSQELGGHFGTTRERYLTTNGGVDFTRTLSKRSSVSFSFYHARNDYSATNFDVRDTSIAGRFTRSLSKGLGLRLGYAYRTTDYGGGIGGPKAYDARTIDAGVDYNRSLSFSRRTKLSFATGTGAYNDQANTFYIVTGNVHLNREIGRTWNASLRYDRGVNVDNQLRQPTVSDSLSAGFGGLISRRVQYHASAGAARGYVGFTNSSDYTSYTASTGIGFDVSRNTSLSVDYAFYNYGFAAAGLTPIGVPQKLTRNTVQANLNFWLPLMRGRTPNATR